MIGGGGGIRQRVLGAVRDGVKPAEKLSVWVYGKHVNRDDFTLVEGKGANDTSRLGDGSFRLDWEPSNFPREP